MTKKDAAKQFFNYVNGAIYAMKPEAVDAAVFMARDFFAGDDGELTIREVAKQKEYSGYGYSIENGTAIIPIKGIIEKEFSWWSWFFGGVSTMMLAKDIKNALNDSSVKSILLDIDSPGGMCDGTKELSDLIFSSRGKKPIYAFANGTMASAAYYIGSSADEVYTYDSSMVGSIGVVMVHVDASEYFKNMGVKLTVIRSGDYKYIGNQYEALTPATYEVMKSEVDYLADTFTSDVARNRNADKKYTYDVMGQGRVFIGKQAVDVGLVDDLSSFDNLKIQIVSENNNPNRVKGDYMLGEMTALKLQEKHSEVFTEVFEKGKAEGLKTKAAEIEQVKATADADKASAVTAVKTETEKNERERAGKIIALASEDQKELAIKLYSDGKSVEEATVELLKNAQATKAEALKEFAAAAPSADKPAGEAASTDTAKVLEKFDADKKFAAKYQDKGGKPALEESLKTWASDEKARNEFAGDLDKFLAYERNHKRKES